MIVFSMLSIGVLTSQVCPTTLPNQQTFETNLGVWQQSPYDDFDWTRTNNATPTGGTGPVGAMNGDYYLYAEATGHTNQTAVIFTCFDFRNSCSAEIEFNYHMLGSNIATLLLQASTDGINWNNVWVENGDQGNTWYVGNVDLNAYLGQEIALQFVAVNNGDQGDIALDNIRVRGPIGSPVSVNLDLGDWNYYLLTVHIQAQVSLVLLSMLHKQE